MNLGLRSAKAKKNPAGWVGGQPVLRLVSLSLSAGGKRSKSDLDNRNRIENAEDKPNITEPHSLLAIFENATVKISRLGTRPRFDCGQKHFLHARVPFDHSCCNRGLLFSFFARLGVSQLIVPGQYLGQLSLDIVAHLAIPFGGLLLVDLAVLLL